MDLQHLYMFETSLDYYKYIKEHGMCMHVHTHDLCVLSILFVSFYLGTFLLPQQLVDVIHFSVVNLRDELTETTENCNGGNELKRGTQKDYYSDYHNQAL